MAIRMADMARTYRASSTPRAVESIDRAIENLEASVRRLARLRHRSLPGAVAMSRTYRAERLISLLRKQRAALEVGDRLRADDLHREELALRSRVGGLLMPR